MRSYSLNDKSTRQTVARIMGSTGRYLEKRSGVWFDPMDVQIALLLALRDIDAERAIILSGGQRGPDAGPVALWAAWAKRLAAIDNAGIDEAALRWAVGSAMTVVFGLQGGSLLIYRDNWDLVVHPLVYDPFAPVLDGLTVQLN